MSLASFRWLGFSILILSAASAGFAISTSSGFGTKGRSGFDGPSGRNGRNGAPATVQATGQPVTIYGSGEDGGDGLDGRDGENAGNCHQPQPAAEDLFGAEGGSGGDGGNAGSGGNGGDLTIYTNDIQNLRSVYVNAEGGRAGRAGRPGYGGRGCACQTKSWIIKKCDNVGGADVCKDLSFSCRDGSRGHVGQEGSWGRPGTMGTLTVVPQLQPVGSVQPHIKIGMSQLLQGPFTLSENIWFTRYGAVALLGPGSRIADAYQIFDHRQENQIQFAWEDTRPQSDFSRATMDLEISTKDNRVYAQLNKDLWYQAREETRQGILTTVFEKVIYKAEATQLRLTLSGSNKGLTAVIDDSAGQSDVVHSAFYVKLKREKFLNDKTIFEGSIPANLLQKNGQRFTLSLGQIPGVDPQVLKPGVKVGVSVDVTRSLGNFNVTKNLSQSYKIP